ncbi:MAG: site-2 protease family protein [Acidobacteriota bacterium]
MRNNAPDQNLRPSRHNDSREGLGVSFARAALDLDVPGPETCLAPVDPRRPRRFLRFGLPLLLFVGSIITTTANGARFMHNYLHALPPVTQDSDLWPWPWLLHHPSLYASGFAFSATLLFILLVHEFAHYIACRHHGIDATLPWVLPAPTLSGTLGAVIQIRSRIPSRNALMDVGLYGPLAGFIASLIATFVGYALSYPAPATAHSALVQFGSEPLTIQLAHAVLKHWNPALPAFNHLVVHPVLIAGWIGLFITSLNLVPGGQLDGGHILYAVSPRLHRIVTRALPILLIAAGVVWWMGWLLWGVILLLPVMRHPRVDVAPPLTRGRVFLAAIGLAILILTFTPTPFLDNSLLSFFH